MTEIKPEDVNRMLAEHWPEARCTCVELSGRQAVAELNRASRRSVVGSVTLWTETIDNPCAVAHGCYVRPASLDSEPSSP